MPLPLVILSYFLSKKRIILSSALLVILLCELYMRLPFFHQRLEYQVDEVLIATLLPKQRGYMWLGNMSFKSPPITLNSDGHRGKETNWLKPVILTVGNSVAFGSGVEDDEVWNSRLETALRQEPGMQTFQVVNAAHPGHGPYQHYIMIKRVLENHYVNLIIVWVDLADRYFNYIPPEDIPKLLKAAKLRSIMRHYTKGIPFLFNKMKAQLPSIKASLKPKIFQRQKKHAVYSAIIGRKMWQEQHVWWQKMVTLATNRGIPLVFMIHDMMGSDGASFIEECLRGLDSGDGNTYFLRLGPQSFGLNPGNPDRLRKEIKTTLTLKRDPHANPLMYELSARAVFKFLAETHLVEKMAAKTQVGNTESPQTW